MEWRTYDEWLDEDMQVQCGQKATKIDGIPKFNETQVNAVVDFYPEAGEFWDWYKD